MICSVTLCINHSSKIRKLGLTRPRVDFRPGYNVLIGKNGSGKSTLLSALATCAMCQVERTAGKAATKYITTEVLNPRMGGSFSSREEMVQGIRSMFQSHGQGLLDSLRHQAHASEAVVLIDSPETGQDHDNSVQIHEGLIRMAQQYQVIVATNSLIFMRGGHLVDLGQDTLAHLVDETGRLLKGLSEHLGERNRKSDQELA